MATDRYKQTFKIETGTFQENQPAQPSYIIFIIHIVIITSY